METRRGFLQTMAASTPLGIAIVNDLLTNDATAADFVAENTPSVHPPLPGEGRLKEFWDEPVRTLVSLPLPRFEATEIERHTLYCGLLSKLIVHYWNGNKRGKEGKYPWRSAQLLKTGQYNGGDYLGHNIAALAVDANGFVIDFDFNHNELFSSSVEHAESRLIRRIFSLAQLNNGWATRGVMGPLGGTSYSNILSDVTVYTSLESCAQCSGIMALGSVKEVVYLQRDPGQYSIGNILRQLSPVQSSFRAPLPIPADALGFDYFSQLNKAYADFAMEVKSKPFFEPNEGVADRSPSITSFLCTDVALNIVEAASKHFDSVGKTKFPMYRPMRKTGAPSSAMTNEQVLGHVRAFFSYAATEGKRGTPHQL